MEQQRMKLENVKNRLLRGEQVKSTRVERGSYLVQLTHGPEIAFDRNFKPTVDNTIQKAGNGVRESAEGSDEPVNL